MSSSPLVSCVWLRHQLKQGLKNLRLIDSKRLIVHVDVDTAHTHTCSNNNVAIQLFDMRSCMYKYLLGLGSVACLSNSPYKF